MYAEIIKIGNSRGLRIPKAFLKQSNIKNTVQLTVKDHSLIITPYEEVLSFFENYKIFLLKKSNNFKL